MNRHLPLSTVFALTLMLAGACDGAIEMIGTDAGTVTDEGDAGVAPSDAGPGVLDDAGAVPPPPPPVDVLTPGAPERVERGCTPPPLLRLEDIPDDPTLNNRDVDTLAIFEVDGDALIGKHVRDERAAREGLRLWQEVVLRIPTNQRLDLVQLDIYQGSSQAAYFNRRGNVMTSRYGLKIGFNVTNFELNQPDVCAPLEPRRGSFDWSLVHELGHMRGWLDGSWDAFLAAFENVRGDGLGYPEDGSPVLDRDFVTSYAERADGDEDHAESWTTFVMLDLTALPAPSAGEPLALTKVRWMMTQPGLSELRRAIRVTEPDGGDVTVQGAPRLFATRAPTISPPARLLGTWEGTVPADGGVPEHVRRFVFASDDIVSSEVADGLETNRLSLREAHASGTFVQFEDEDDGDLYFYIAERWQLDRVVENFLTEGMADGEAVWSRDGDPQLSDIPLRRME